jgi:hypothetical protein
VLQQQRAQSAAVVGDVDQEGDLRLADCDLLETADRDQLAARLGDQGYMRVLRVRVDR